MEHDTALPDPGQSPIGSTAPSAGGLVARFGAAALCDGYTAIPNVVLRHRRALGITPGEWDYLCELFGYWRAAGDPYPGVDTLAAGLGVDASTIRRHRLSLEGKGLLRVYRAGGHNRYDLSPLIAASIGLARQDCTAVPPCSPAHSDRAILHGEEENLEDIYDYDKTPHPRESSMNDRPATDSVAAGLSMRDHPSCAATLSRETPSEEEILADTLAAIGAELGDDTPASSLTRALNIQRAQAVGTGRFLEAVEHAARRVRDRGPAFRILGADGRPNGMHYFFGVLRRQLRGASTDERDRGRRQHAPPQGVAAAWAARPQPVPVAETHPVWRAALEELRQILTAGNFDTYLARSRVVAEDGAVLCVAVPDRFAKGWLECKLAQRVADALRQVGRSEVRVEYVVEGAA